MTEQAPMDPRWGPIFENRPTNENDQRESAEREENDTP